MLYLIIKEAVYYPSGGTYDWKLLTADEAEALAAWAALPDDDLSYVYTLVRIDPSIPTYTQLDYK